MLVEAYRSESDPAEHKKTAHYATWRDTVVDMMAEPRSSVKYDSVFQDEDDGIAPANSTSEPRALCVSAPRRS